MYIKQLELAHLRLSLRVFLTYFHIGVGYQLMLDEAYYHDRKLPMLIASPNPTDNHQRYDSIKPLTVTPDGPLSLTTSSMRAVNFPAAFVHHGRVALHKVAPAPISATLQFRQAMRTWHVQF